MGTVVDITGQRFGMWAVIESRGLNKHRKAMWLCRCDCGNELVVQGAHLRSGASTNCGCVRLANQTKHGQRNLLEYQIWLAMTRRTTNPNDPQWSNYGARGIRVCERWREFANFLADMGRRPLGKDSIDRIDNDGDYCPENCRWATWTEQQRNKRDNFVIEVKGQRRCVAEWCELLEIPRHKLDPRGKTIEQLRQVILAADPADAILALEQTEDEP